MKQLAVVTFATAMSASAAGADRISDDKWSSGWGQGIAEASVTQGSGNMILVACTDGSETASTGIWFEIGGEVVRDDAIILTFDGADPERISLFERGNITTSGKADTETYLWVIEQLKSHNRVHVMTLDGRSAAFTLNGAAEAIGDCVPDVYR